jgi:hypothetical protein
MEIYSNPFDPNEDAMLWELHEIRHELHQTLCHKTVDEINADALRKYQCWQKDVGKKPVKVRADNHPIRKRPIPVS